MRKARNNGQEDDVAPVAAGDGREVKLDGQFPIDPRVEVLERLIVEKDRRLVDLEVERNHWVEAME